MEKLKSDIKTIVIILLLITMLFGYCTMNSIKKAEIKKVHDSYESLLQDTITKVITKRDTFWQFKISTLSPKEIKETAVYKELEKSKRDLIKELEKNKNLLAIANLQLSATKEQLETLKDTLFWIKDSLFQAKDGTLLVFQDTTGGFQYKEEIKLSDPIIRKTFYSLSITPDFRITKLNKYGVQGEFRIQGLEEFDELTLTHGYSYYSTLTPKEIRKQKILKGLKITGIAILPLITGYTGYELGKVIN